MEDPGPFLKWAGGKGQLLGQLRGLLPTPLPCRYFEPFVGSGALFFALRPEEATLTDVNRELIDCYRAIQKQVGKVIAALEQHVYEKEAYYAVRAVDPASLPLPARAARTIYLNKAGFNGLYRVNSRGLFNVPFGRHTSPGFRTPGRLENLRACAAALRGVALEVADFAEVVARARRGDFVYFDPPYVPLSGTAYFTSYSSGGFGPAEQERLAAVFGELTRAGVKAMLSNSDTPFVRKLYRGHRIETVHATRNINSKASARGVVKEVVVRNYA